MRRTALRNLPIDNRRLHLGGRRTEGFQHEQSCAVQALLQLGYRSTTCLFLIRVRCAITCRSAMPNSAAI